MHSEPAHTTTNPLQEDTMNTTTTALETIPVWLVDVGDVLLDGADNQFTVSGLDADIRANAGRVAIYCGPERITYAPDAVIRRVAEGNLPTDEPMGRLLAILTGEA